MEQKHFYINNRKVKHDFFVEDTYRAGIVLSGSEVKSLRQSKANIAEAYCFFTNGELFLKNSFISNSGNCGMFSHDEICDRKLLLSKKELRKLEKTVKVKGYSIMPISIYVPSHGYIKIEIGLCKGKHDYDKRETIKERDIERELNRL